MSRNTAVVTNECGAAAVAARGAAGAGRLRRLARRWLAGWVAHVKAERPALPRPPEERGGTALPYTELAGFR